jgi:glucosyl-dolichyl phosphate glucuronosyltransferase
MFITVLICTRDRPESLQRTLDSLLTPPNIASLDWELLVVAKDSTGETTAVCENTQKKFPQHFRFLIQRTTGKSNGLNEGIAAARGDVLAMTDDDITAAPEYLQGIRTVFSQPDVDAAQGRVLLDCEGGTPKWMDRQISLVMDAHDFGDKMLEWKRHLAGVSMIVRAAVVPKIGGFRTDLGPGVGGAAFTEDSEFAERLQKAGFRAVYAPQITVYHHWPRERLTKAYVRDRYFNVGRSVALYRPLPAPLWRFALYAARIYVFSEAASLWYRLSGQPAKAMHSQCNARHNVGFVLQHWRLQHQMPSGSPKVPTASP